MKKGAAIKAVVFDLGGVLEYDSRPQVDSHICRRLGIGLRSCRRHLPGLVARLQTGEITERQMWQQFCGKVGRALPRNWRELLRKPHSRHFRVLEDTLNIVRELKGKGYLLGLLSNTQAAHSRKEHRQRTFKHFDLVFLSHLQGKRKPDEEAYQTVLDKLGVPAHQAVYVDNVREYVSAANNLGMKGIWFRNARQLAERLEKMGLLTKK